MPSCQALLTCRGPAGLRSLSGPPREPEEDQQLESAAGQTLLCRLSFLRGDSRRDGTSGGGECKHGGAQPNVNRRWWRLTFTQVLFRELSFFVLFCFFRGPAAEQLDGWQDNKGSLASGHLLNHQQAAVQ